MLRLGKFTKSIAFFLLVLFATEIIFPTISYALTSGPVQPETKGFEQAGTNGMVDLFSGDFTYNIPLLDVGGYPVNISYHSGSGMDDEASWTGLGWSLTPGVLNRQMRGLPDDFDGKYDKIAKEYSVKDDITAGVKLSVTPEIFGFDLSKALQFTPSADIFYNNQRGLGVEFNLGVNVPLTGSTKAIAGQHTAGLAATANLSFGNQSGATFSPGINLAVTEAAKENQDKNTASLNLGAAINSRAGWQSTTLSTSFGIIKDELKEKKAVVRSLNASYTSYAGPTFLPKSPATFRNESFAISPSVGTEVQGFHAAIQITGHYSRQTVADKRFSRPAYGYLNAHKGAKVDKALMDFNREKDAPYFKEVPNLPIPYATPDLFVASSQDGSQQFRAFTSGSGVFFDSENTNLSFAASGGFEVGAGAGAKTGADIQANVGATVTSKWKNKKNFLNIIGEEVNPFLDKGDFSETGRANDSYKDLYEPAYFKKVGEVTPSDGSIFNEVSGSDPVRVKTEGNPIAAYAREAFITKNGNEIPINNKLTRNGKHIRDRRNALFSYLTVGEAEKNGLDRGVRNYVTYQNNKNFLANCTQAPLEPRPALQKHHIGEVTITDEGGKRTVYGIPVYNNIQEDVSFNVGPKKQNSSIISRSPEDIRDGLVTYDSEDASIRNKRGTDHYFSKETIPAYATSFLLTGILSPDYVDLTGNGISDDDLGSFVKFNYQKTTNSFQWRTPYAPNKANYNDGLLSDPKDDKASYSYGSKELWYQHSIESKTMVALFYVGDREDALGCDRNGIKDLSTKQKYLQKIELYSKSELLNPKIPGRPEPIKTVNFEYDYSLCTGVPNNSGTQPLPADPHIKANQGGKLTLKKIYFTYGFNDRGKLNPYQFVYNSGKPYQAKKYDRWGNYKDNTDNPNNLSNDYFVYSTQNKTQADANASLWQITQIITPAGAIINISYESDDYAYVQNRRACSMFTLVGIGQYNKNNDYYRTNKLFVQLAGPVTNDQELIAKYFDGFANNFNRKLYFKTFVNLDNKGHQDYVSGYADIESVRLLPGYSNVAEITVATVKGDGAAGSNNYHPVAKAAWQFMRLSTPKYVYPGYDVKDELPPVQYIKALIGAISSVQELLSPFDTRAVLKKLAPSIELSKSWVRLNNPGSKLGGGHRVKRITMSDEWSAMTNNSSNSANYGQEYDYTTTETLPDGRSITISSGVACYEPMLGIEENPFRVPIEFQQKVKLGPDNLHYIEEPLCESYFPAPSVGYGKVTVRNIGADGSVGKNGYSSSEFYTAKDFPTLVTQTPIASEKFGGSSILKTLKIKQNHSKVVSQGYTVELNDMHGKPKADKVFDKTGKELSSAFYYYKTLNQNTSGRRLNNEATVITNDGSVTNAIIGRDVEIYHDMREQTTVNFGVNVMVNVDYLFLLIATVPVPSVLPLPNSDYLGFRSSSTIKIIQQYGLLDKVVKTQNGSSIETQNLAWDAETGQVLLTRTQNEFDDPVYNFNYPAHWRYNDGMGLAYKNSGLIINGLSTGANGVISSGSTYLVSGDELIVTNSSGVETKYWVNETAPGGTKVLIDFNGQTVSSLSNLAAKVVRSGRRNMPGAPIGSLLSLKNPIRSGKIDVGDFTRVINTSAVVFRDDWAVSLLNLKKSEQICPDGYTSIPSEAELLAERTYWQNNYNNCISGGGTPTSCQYLQDQINRINALLPYAGRCYKDVTTVSDPAYTVNTLATKVTARTYSVCPTILTSTTGAWATLTASDPSPGSTRADLSTLDVWRNGTVCTGTNPGGNLASNGPLNRSGVWITQQNSTNYRNEWVGFKTKVYFRSAETRFKTTNGLNGIFYLGFGADNEIEVRINNSLVAARANNTETNSTSAMRTWRIKQVSIPLDVQVEIFVRVRNVGTSTPNPAALGVEIYNNTFSELQAATCVEEACWGCSYCASCLTSSSSAAPLISCANRALIIWSSKCMLGKRFNYHVSSTGTVLNDFNPSCVGGTLFEDGNCDIKCSIIQRLYADKITREYCALPAGEIVNPYTTGIKGNWRTEKSFVYHADRASVNPRIVPPASAVTEGTDIRKAGAFTSYTPFWKFLGSQLQSQDPEDINKQSTLDANWIRSNVMTRFNSKGMELENKDAINQYSSALFGYLESVPVAVASNSRSHEIAYDGFEDYGFKLDMCNTVTDSCNKGGHFGVGDLLSRFPSSLSISSQEAHTGRNSLKINAGFSNALIVKPVYQSSNELVRYQVNANNQTLTQLGGLVPPFSPEAGKKYVLNAWIKGNADLTGTNNSQAGIEILNASNIVIATTIKAGPLVEGWRKVEAIFIVPSVSSIQIRLRPGNAIAYFDDIRIHPYDGQMKTFVYDNKSMRLWAELDENNFASFYEYDDEGTLIRVKKETEKGIMTIRESRSTLKVTQ